MTVTKHKSAAARRRLFGWTLLVLALPGCSGRAPSQLNDPIVQQRLARDTAFKTEEDSPIPPAERPGFQGLAYYPIDPALRFSVRLERYQSPQQVRLGTNTGEIRSALRYGSFDFTVGTQACRLEVYKLEDGPDHGASLFVPFRDATSGKETYGAGRYIDLKENTSGVYTLDFNRAYNPSCAYNSDYSCPVPPAVNTLKVPIRAGEKKYSGSH